MAWNPRFVPPDRIAPRDDTDPPRKLAAWLLQYAPPNWSARGFDQSPAIRHRTVQEPPQKRVAWAFQQPAYTGGNIISVRQSSPTAVNVWLPPSPGAGRLCLVKDAAGVAGSSNLTIRTRDGTTIDGAATLVLSTNYQSYGLLFDGEEWISLWIGGGGSGSGTVNSGTAGQVAYYGSAGTAVSGEGIGTLLDSGLSFSTTGYLSRTGAGTFAIVADGSTHQVLHGGGSWGAVSLTADVSGTLPVASGGTGLTGGTSGGIPYYSSSSAMTSSGALAANALVLGGGAGASPTTDADWTISSHVLTGNVGTATPRAESIGTTLAQLQGADGGSANVVIDTYANALTGTYGRIIMRHSGGTSASPSGCPSGHALFQLYGGGYGASAFNEAAFVMEALATETWTNTAAGCKFSVFTTKTGSLTLGEVATFENDGGLTIPSSVTGGSKGAGTANVTGGYYVEGTNVTPGQLAVYQSGTLSPAGTTSTSYVMAGLAGSITPKYTGRVLVTITGTMSNSTAGDSCLAACVYGTGVAPSNGAAATGTAFGTVSRGESTSASAYVPFTCTGIITGLTPGTAIWIDLQQRAAPGGTATLSGIAISAIEI